MPGICYCIVWFHFRDCRDPESDTDIGGLDLSMGDLDISGMSGLETLHVSVASVEDNGKEFILEIL